MTVEDGRPNRPLSNLSRGHPRSVLAVPVAGEEGYGLSAALFTKHGTHVVQDVLGAQLKAWRHLHLAAGLTETSSALVLLLLGPLSEQCQGLVSIRGRGDRLHLQQPDIAVPAEKRNTHQFSSVVAGNQWPMKGHGSGINYTGMD